jgi:predicted MPP superfamily phosphohydrolase
MRKLIATIAVVASLTNWAQAADVTLPVASDSLKFAIIGDNGTGDTPEYDVGRQMATARNRFPFELVMMLGDNMYGRQQPQDFVDKFQRPYAALLRAGVPFYAALGNHDSPSNRSFQPFHMDGERYYTFAQKDVRFIVLDSNAMDQAQLSWLQSQLESARESWKLVFFHHPLYSDGKRHGPSVELRVLLEPLFVRYGVSAVFSGHDHIYERTQPQHGITYFIEGSSGQLRKGDVKRSDVTAAAFDQDQTFMLVEVAGEEMTFQAISRTGQIVDSGTVHRRAVT